MAPGVLTFLYTMSAPPEAPIATSNLPSELKSARQTAEATPERVLEEAGTKLTEPGVLTLRSACKEAVQPTIKSGCPSPSRSPRRTRRGPFRVGIETGGSNARALVLLLRKTETEFVDEPKIKSGLPSPSTSAVAISMACGLVAKTKPGPNEIAPGVLVFGNTIAEFVKKPSTATSSRPSPLKSAST